MNFQLSNIFTFDSLCTVVVFMRFRLKHCACNAYWLWLWLCIFAGIGCLYHDSMYVLYMNTCCVCIAAHCCARFDLQYSAADCQCWSYVITSYFHSIFWFSMLVCMRFFLKRKDNNNRTKLDIRREWNAIFMNCNLYVNNIQKRVNFFNCHKYCCCFFSVVSNLLYFDGAHIC